jgi:hypothetical protein
MPDEEKSKRVAEALEIAKNIPDQDFTSHVQSISGRAFCARHPDHPEEPTGQPGRNNSSGVAAFYACPTIGEIDAQLVQFGGRKGRGLFQWDYTGLNLLNVSKLAEKHGIQDCLTYAKQDGGWEVTQYLSDRARSVGCSGTTTPDVYNPAVKNVVLHLLDNQVVDSGTFIRIDWPNEG